MTEPQPSHTPPVLSTSGEEAPQSSLAEAFEESVARPTREAVNKFFYPGGEDHPRNENGPPSPQRTDGLMRASSGELSGSEDNPFQQQDAKDRLFVEHFWTTYDDIIILAILTQVGIVCRLAISVWFRYFDNVFSNESALFTNLPLNCLSCFLMGTLCSGERLMEIIVTRFSPPRLQQEMAPKNTNANQQSSSQHDDDGMEGMAWEQPLNRSPTVRRRRRRRQKRRKEDQFFRSWQPPVHLNEDLRDVQLLALERRIRASKCLLLFPVRKEDVDVMEHYFDGGYQRRMEEQAEEGSSSHHHDMELGFDLALDEGHVNDPSCSHHDGHDDQHAIEMTVPAAREESAVATPSRYADPAAASTPTVLADPLQSAPTDTTNDNYDENNSSDDMEAVELEEPPPAESSDAPVIQGQTDLNQMVTHVHANVSENISRLRRVDLAAGWDQGTTPEAMSDDLMLGLRDGFCGALSSFSSWNSAMVNLMRKGDVGTAFVGYMLGLQLPIVAYRFGQYVAVYIFIWRCRYEAKRDERRGYGIRLTMNDGSENDELAEADGEGPLPMSPATGIKDHKDRKLPSIRAIVTAIFVMFLVAQSTSLSFFEDPQNQQLAFSLLFSPLGVLARWRLSKSNSWRPGFPIGTFTSNMLACALSGGLGTLLAGNPDAEERIVLQSFINGFGGTLSSLAAFITEILAGVDPVLFRFDGIWYACLSIFWAMVTGFVFSASADWADQLATRETPAPVTIPSFAPSLAPTS